MEEDQAQRATNRSYMKSEASIYAIFFFVTLAFVWSGISQAPGSIEEETTRVAIASQIASTGNLDPYWYGHPATLINYFLALAYKLFYTVQDAPFTRLTYILDHEKLVIIGRVISRLAAATCGPLTYMLARSILPIRWALLATLITVLNPLFITHAHRARADHILTLILLSAGLVSGSSKPIKDSVVPLSLIAGLGITFKYLAASVLGSIQLLLTLETSLTWKQKLSKTIQSIATLGATIFIASPYLYLNANKAFGDLTGEVTKKQAWEPGAALVKFLLINSYGYSGLFGVIFLVIILVIIAETICLAHTSWSSVRNAAITRISIIYVPFILVGFLASTYNSTWLTPALPYLSICIAFGLRTFLGERSTSFSPLRRSLVIAATCILITSQVNHSWSVHQLRIQTGSKSEAELWLSKHEDQVRSVLMLQGNNTESEAAIFPRFNPKAYRLFIAQPNGEFSRVCDEPAADWVTSNPSTHLIHTNCFPQPVFNSKSKESIDSLLNQFDLVVVSDRHKDDKSDNSKEIASFSPPRNIVKRDYSRANHPQGDAGPWTTITIYSNNE